MKLSLLNILKNLRLFVYPRKVKNSEQKSSGQNLFLGIDPAKPDAETSVLSIKDSAGKSSHFAIPKLKTFSESFSHFESFVCDGTCHLGSNICTHIFIFACPQCRQPIRAIAEEMEYFAGAGEDCICFDCWRIKDRKAA